MRKNFLETHNSVNFTTASNRRFHVKMQVFSRRIIFCDTGTAPQYFWKGSINTLHDFSTL